LVHLDLLAQIKKAVSKSLRKASGAQFATLIGILLMLRSLAGPWAIRTEAQLENLANSKLVI
jgi:hypothetical protein